MGVPGGRMGEYFAKLQNRCWGSKKKLKMYCNFTHLYAYGCTLKKNNQRKSKSNQND